MTGQEQDRIIENIVKPLFDTLGTAVELRQDLDHAMYLLRFARERLAHSIVAATVDSETVEQIDKFLKEHNR